MNIERIPTHVIAQPIIVADTAKKRFWQQATTDIYDNEWYEITRGHKDRTRWCRIDAEMIRIEDACRLDA